MGGMKERKGSKKKIQAKEKNVIYVEIRKIF